MKTPTMVRNNERGPAVFEAEGVKVEWAGSGDVMGGDIMPVPDKVLDSVQFHSMVVRGIFSIEQGGEEIEAALDAQRRAYQDRMARQQAASQAALDQAPNNDLLMLGCVGPADSGRGKCGMQVPVKASHQAVQPPLCSQHVPLQGHFVAQEIDGKVIGGKAEVTWVPIKLGATERQN
jgi:hypothetical protein